MILKKCINYFLPGSSLKTRMTLFTLAIFLISIWSLAFYASKILRQDVQHLVSSQQFSTVSLVAQGINEELESRIKALEDLASSIGPLMSGNSTLLQTFLEQRTVFQSLFNAGTFVTRIDGIAIADYPLSSERIGVNYSDRDFMPTVLKEGRSTISRPIMGKKLEAPLFAMAVPIRDAQGKVIGSLIGGTDLSKPNFLDKIEKNTYGKTGGYILVAPKHGLFVTGTDKKRHTMQPLPALGINPLLDRYRQGFEGSGIITDSRGFEVLSAAKQIPIAGWFVVVRVPTIEAFAPIDDLQRKMLLVTVFTTLLAGGFTWLMLHRQLAPMLETVTTLVDMTKSGQRPQLLPVTRQDEIGQLISSFNDLLITSAQREEAQIESEDRFRRVSSLISDVAYSCSRNADGCCSINWMTGATEKICGYSVEEITARKCWRFLVLEEDLPQFDQNIINLSPGSHRLIDLRIRHKKGNIVWISVATECVMAPETLNRSLFYGCFVDITERKRGEEEKKLLQEKLLQAQKMEAIGTLAGGIAHDFNNILGAIIGYAEIARDDTPPGSAVTNSLDKVLEASQRAVGLVKQILAFSRQEKIEHIPLQLTSIVKEATKLLHSSIPSTIEIRSEINVATRLILADPTQIHQILMNLCTNAYHAMEHSGGIIQITLKDCELSQEDLHQHPNLKPANFVELSVSDTGSGIAPDIWGRIFDPYFTTKGVGKGTGMGLSIVHGIVTSYGGFITSENNQGGGTVFRVYFPAVDKEMLPEAKSVKATPQGSEHILFVDDETMLAGLGKAMLEQLGYSVTACTSGQNAWNTFKNQPDRFDAVVTDQTMPGLTGIDLASQILQIRPDLPIILCTGYSTLIGEEQAKAAGVKGFAMKPLSKKVIATLLREVIDKGILPD